jgi:hypothetical protein
MKIIAAPSYARSSMALACPIVDLGEQRQDIRSADRAVAQFLSAVKLAKSA